MTKRLVACLTRSGLLLLGVAAGAAGQGGAPARRAVSDSVTLWVGDTVPVAPPERAAAPAMDTTARATDPTYPAWTSTDSGVATVARGAIIGEGAGTARIALRYDSVVVSLDVAVLPVVLGRVFTPGGEDIQGLRVVVQRDGRPDSADVSPDGAFAVRLSAPAPGAVEVAVDAAAPAARRFHPALLRLPARDLAREVRLVLVPATWLVTSGRYAGQSVRVSAAAALRRTSDRGRFWRLQESRGSARVVGWPQELLPLPVAFRREGGGAIGAADSAAFWAILDSLEADMGIDLVRPALYEDVRGQKDGIVVEIDGELSTAGLALAAWNQQGRIIGATVSFRSARTLGDAHVATHEMLHALGFGHTGSWPSVMGSGSHRPTRPTVHDVAHAQLLFRVLDAQRVRDAPYGILDAEAGERRLGGRREPDAADRRAAASPERR